MIISMSSSWRIFTAFNYKGLYSALTIMSMALIPWVFTMVYCEAFTSMMLVGMGRRLFKGPDGLSAFQFTCEALLSIRLGN